MSRISDLLATLRTQAEAVKALDVRLSPIITDAADVIEHLQRVNRERLVELEQARLELDVLNMPRQPPPRSLWKCACGSDQVETIGFYTEMIAIDDAVDVLQMRCGDCGKEWEQ